MRRNYWLTAEVPMFDWLFAYHGLDFFFLVCAIVGSVLLTMRLLLMVLGFGGDGDTHHADTDIGFKLLSIQGITAFLTMFGLTGFAVLRGSSLGATIAVIAAIVAGIGSAWIVGRVFMSMLRLQSSGSVGLAQTVGCTGTVYANISKQGGSVQITVAQRLREFDAVSSTGDELPTGTPIRVVKLLGQGVVVERLS
jgi:membrane protein implicated in regulation of membrane protease activity